MGDHRDLVAALLQVPGVAAAAVEPAEGDPGTLRLQLAPGVDEVEVAGAVNVLLRDRFGLAVDADRVRVVDEPADGEAVNGKSVDEPTVAAPTVVSARPSRVVIERVQVVSAGLGTSVSVALRLDGATYEGSAEGTATAGSLHRSVAGATLRAVEGVVGGTARFDVDHVEVAGTGTDRTALAVVTMVTGRSTERLSGASVVREDVRQAVIRAVLAAVNRRLEPMLSDRPTQPDQPDKPE